MEGKNNITSSSGSNKCSSKDVQGVQVAPFVAKTYEMVCDPRTDALIRWGRENNSFLVMDPADFSLLLLPFYFKHSNFSSFVRQLNTYGFRKVDPDRWGFAHESFLRGQTHLLPLIVRRKKKMDNTTTKKNPFLEEEEEEEEEEGEEMMIKEIGRLRREQRALEGELEGMNKRLQVTEQRPHQMISFLVRVAEDPDLLPRLILSKKEQQKQQKLDQKIKKPRMTNSTTYCLPPLPQSFETGELDVNNVQMQSTSYGVNDDSTMDQIGSGNQVILLPEFGAPAAETNTVAYPFSLLGHVFF